MRGVDPACDSIFVDDPVCETDLSGQEERTPFAITDDALADWAIRKIAEARANTVMMKDHFDRQLLAVQRRNEETEAFFTAALAAYFETVPRHTAKTQTRYALPSGELVRKKQLPEFSMDENQLVPFLRENGLDEFVKLKPSSDWAALKKTCTVLDDGTVVEQSTGMALPGVTAEFRPDKFEVKING